MKANHNVVVDASIDREHDLVITDVILRLEDPRVDSIGLREDLRGEFDRAAGRTRWTRKVFQSSLVPGVETVLFTVSLNVFIARATRSLQSEGITKVPEILVDTAYAALPLVNYWSCSTLDVHC